MSLLFFFCVGRILVKCLIAIRNKILCLLELLAFALTKTLLAARCSHKLPCRLIPAARSVWGIAATVGNKVMPVYIEEKK